jgi:hypothetical protein
MRPYLRPAATIVLALAPLALPAADPRAARSVHLGYPAPDATLFTTAMTVVDTTPGSYFMAAGWSTGYFGVQELADGRRVVIFSVWDPTAGDDPQAVKGEDRVECLHSGEGLRIKRFGGEGTGGQCMGDLDWKVGDAVRFAVVARVDGVKTAYEGHLKPSEADPWTHLVTFRTRTGGQPLRGLYSFVEDFRRDGRSVHEVRRARFHDGWVRGTDGAWTPLVRARFTASGADWEAKDSIDAGVAAGMFSLATGGELRPSRPLGSMLDLPVAERHPPDLPFAGADSSGITAPRPPTPPRDRPEPR